MIGHFAQALDRPSSWTSVQPQGASHPHHLHSISPPATQRQPSGNYHKGITREDGKDINRERGSEDLQPMMGTLTSSVPESLPFQPQPANPYDMRRGSHLTTNSNPRNGDGRFGDGGSPYIYEAPATGPLRLSPQDQQPEPDMVFYYPSTYRPREDGEIRENRFRDYNYDEGAGMVDNRLAQIPGSSTQTQERHLQPTKCGVGPGSPIADALTFQQCILVTVRELCTDAARGYWQIKRPRPRLVLDIPSSRAIRRREPYPERMRGDIPQYRHSHDPHRTLPWTRELGDRPFAYSDSLEELIWRITDQEWTQATMKSQDWNSTGAHAERLTAIRRMSKLYCWTQIVIQAVEQVHVDQNVLNHSRMTDVMLAARDLAVWLLADREKSEIQQLWGDVIAAGVKSIEG